MRANQTPFRLRKSLGQHLLRDRNIARKIIRAILPEPGDVMVEIGPGNGILTRELAGLVRRLVAVEIDSRMVDLLQTSLPPGAAEILHRDFLTLDLSVLAAESGGRLRIAGNIPYRITTPILFHMLAHRDSVRDATLMMQREVARRLVAQPGSKEYGILSVFCRMGSDVRTVFDVSPAAFVPRPKVFSSVVQLHFLSSPRCPVANEEFFVRMVRAVFNKRRKTLRNSLSYFLGKAPGAAGLPVDLSRRPEDLSLEELAALSNSLVAAP